MLKQVASILVAVGLLAGCSNKDENYYRTHPMELQKAIGECSGRTSGLSCDQLKAIASDISRLAYELQLNPQAFGRKIISLQEQLAAKQSEYQKDASNQRLGQSIQAIQEELAQRMAIVKWLESPKG
ncbi:hypothetical protein ACFORL_10005 [Legionella dresdenensis]|uniref:Secreted endonuclease n=1 Tax=Legionella dresdenensis TaxID=450200 RepID=A0ABV8CGT6_9GAMM